jgi:hypothetical protein
VRRPDGVLRLPKRNLTFAILVLLQNRQSKVAEALDLRRTLVKEILAVR